MDDVLEQSRRLLDEGDPVGAVRSLRWVIDDVPVAETARLVGESARLLGLTELAGRAAAVARRPRSARALFAFGYGCIDEGGLSFVAVPVLRAALQARPRHRDTLIELVVALQNCDRHREAVALLEERVADLPPWPERYLLAANALLAGDHERAVRHTRLLPPAPDRQFAVLERWLRGAVDRLSALREHRPIDDRDLRGWHYVLNAGLLGCVSVHGLDEGMNGRFGWLQDSPAVLRLGLERLRTALAVAGRRPRAVGLLPERSSTILGLAAAVLLDLPSEPYDPTAPDTLVLAYDLQELDGDTVRTLADRAPGQLLVEHACRWTDPPGVAAEFTVLLGQSVVPPWEAQLVLTPGGDAQRGEPDDRPAGEIAAGIASADPARAGSDTTPPGDADALAAMATAVGPAWPSRAVERHPVRSPGPVASSSFR